MWKLGSRRDTRERLRQAGKKRVFGRKGFMGKEIRGGTVCVTLILCVMSGFRVEAKRSHLKGSNSI